MFDKPISCELQGSSSCIVKVAFSVGSSQQGNSLRADVGHKKVTAANLFSLQNIKSCNSNYSILHSYEMR